MSNLKAYSPEYIETLKRPVAWNDFTRENLPDDIGFKRARAETLQVPAVVFTEREVDERITEMARLERMLHWDDIKSQQIFYLTVLNGGAKFAGQFIDIVANGKKYGNEQALHPLGANLHLGSYGSGQDSSEPELFNRLNPKGGHNVADKDIVLLDDGTDTGRSANTAAEILLDGDAVRRLGFGTGPARSVSARFLTDKGISRLDDELLAIDQIVVGFMAPNVWLGGMGFDGRRQDANLYDLGRNLREITITQTQHEKYKANMVDVVAMLGERCLATDIDADFSWIGDPPAISDLQDQHGVAEAVKAISLGDGVVINPL